MEQNEITQIYETLAPMAGQYASAQAEQIGQAQQSMGPLAAATMGQSQTSGLGNYTYNRLMRPQVDVMRDEILVEGYRNKLNQALSNAYKTAQRNYSRRASGGGGGGGGTTSPSSVNDKTETEVTDDEQYGKEVGSKTPAMSGEPTKEGDKGTASNMTPEQLENVREWAKWYRSVYGVGR